MYTYLMALLLWLMASVDRRRCQRPRPSSTLGSLGPPHQQHYKTHHKCHFAVLLMPMVFLVLLMERWATLNVIFISDSSLSFLGNHDGLVGNIVIIHVFKALLRSLSIIIATLDNMSITSSITRLWTIHSNIFCLHNFLLGRSFWVLGGTSLGQLNFFLLVLCFFLLFFLFSPFYLSQIISF